jgi:D-3-phosphoglycerate dehydrogenase / 2-oxoglutarate reductase
MKILFSILPYFLLPYVAIRSVKDRSFRNSVAERMPQRKDFPTLNNEIRFWFHGASLGELRGVVPVLKNILQEGISEEEILITTTSLTGQKFLAESFPQIHRRLLPLDFRRYYLRLIEHYKPKILVIAETELWPNLFLAAEKKALPIVIFNARISDKTFPRYFFFRSLLKNLFNSVIEVFTQTDLDSRRFRLIGIPHEQVQRIGSTKFDIQLIDYEKQLFEQLQADLEIYNKPVLFFMSSRSGEEEIFLRVFEKLRNSIPNVMIMIAPRYVERVPEIREILGKTSYKTSFRSDTSLTPCDVLVIDTYGEIQLFSHLSTLVVVGGSFFPTGGHSPLEAAALGKATIIGPSNSNQKAILDELEVGKGVLVVQNEEELFEQARLLLQNEQLQNSIGHFAQEKVQQALGASEKLKNFLIEQTNKEIINKNTLNIKKKQKNCFLLFCSSLFSFVTGLRNKLYDVGIFPTYTSTLPVISLGNISVGGNGKTPTAILLATMLKKMGYQPVVLSRGYGGSNAGPAFVDPTGDPKIFGDEPVLIAQKLLSENIPVVIARKRVQGALYIERTKIGDVIILDDGFQHRALNRNCNLVLTDISLQSFQESILEGELLPAGKLRETWNYAKKRIDACLFLSQETQLFDGQLVGGIPTFSLLIQVKRIIQPISKRQFLLEDLRKSGVSLLCAIAQPERFKKSIEKLGIPIHKTRFLKDHADLKAEDFDLLAEIVLVTEKDWTKLSRLGVDVERIGIVELELDFLEDDQEKFISFLTKKILAERIHEWAESPLIESGCSIQRVDGAIEGQALQKALLESQIIGIRSRTKIRAEALEQAKNLLAIGCYSIGTDQVDLDPALLKGIPVFNAPHSSTRSVAELALGLVIMLQRRIFLKSTKMHLGTWDKALDGASEVRGKTIGIVGYGHIGQQVGLMAEALGMEVCFYDVIKKLPLSRARVVSTLNELLAVSDVVTLHIPGGKANRNLFSAEQFLQMKAGSQFLNLSRGEVVDISALAEVLKSKHLSGAALDVYPTEPQQALSEFSSELLGLENVILTPHIGGNTIEAQANIGLEVSRVLSRYLLEGSTLGAVNFPQVSLPQAPTKIRIANIHKNVPGALADITEVLSNAQVNIEAQALGTMGAVGYVLIDTDQPVSTDVQNALLALPVTMKNRILG